MTQFELITFHGTLSDIEDRLNEFAKNNKIIKWEVVPLKTLGSDNLMIIEYSKKEKKIGT